MRIERKKVSLLTTILLLSYLSGVLYLCLAKLNLHPLKLNLSLGLDKIGHFIMFLPYPLIALLFVKFNVKKIVKKWIIFTIILLFGIGLAILSETAQVLFTDYREADYYDLLADALGILAGTCLTIIFGTQIDNWVEKSIIK